MYTSLPSSSGLHLEDNGDRFLRKDEKIKKQSVESVSSEAASSGCLDSSVFVVAMTPLMGDSRQNRQIR